MVHGHDNGKTTCSEVKRKSEDVRNVLEETCDSLISVSVGASRRGSGVTCELKFFERLDCDCRVESRAPFHARVRLEKSEGRVYIELRASER